MSEQDIKDIAGKLTVAEGLALCKLLVLRLDAEQSIDLYHELEIQNGWAGTVFQRGDVESAVGRPITDEEWDKVQGSYYWHKGLPDICTERGWDLVDEAIRDAGLKREDA